jgi:DNA-binding transcriptional LysR family regulator
VTLSRKGIELLPKATALVDSFTVLSDELSVSRQKGEATVTLGCIPTVMANYLPTVLASFATTFPTRRVVVRDLSATEVLDEVVAGETDFGVTILATDHPELRIQDLLTEPMMLIAAAEHPFAGRAEVSWSELKGRALITIGGRSGNRRLIDMAVDTRIGLNWRYEVQHLGTAVSLVRAGVGMTVLPHIAMSGTVADGVVAIPLVGPEVVRKIALVQRPDTSLARGAADLAAMISRFLRQLGKKR